VIYGGMLESMLAVERNFRDHRDARVRVPLRLTAGPFVF